MRFVFILFSLLFQSLSLADNSIVNYFQSEKLFIQVIDSTATTDTTLIDSLAVIDTLAKAAVVDTLKPLQYLSFSSYTDFTTRIIKQEIVKSDYRYTGNILSNLPFSYNRDLGWYGQPNELFLYGLGYGNLTFMEDGVPINNRLLNSLDLNFVQSEYLDSVEIVSLPQGFYYGSFNNPVTINFITRDHISTRPYTRLRIIQAPEDEGYIDAIFSAYLMDRVNFSFEFSNGAVNSLYENSNSSKWLLNAKVRYMPGNRLNIIGSYSHAKAESRLFGGVDLSALGTGASQDIIDQYLYEPLNADVVYPNRYQKTSRNNYTLKFLGNFIDNAPSDVSIYYQTNLTEFRQNEKNDIPGQPVIFNDNQYSVTGLTARQLLSLRFINFDFNAAYEDITYKADLLGDDKSKQMSSIGGKASLNIFNESFLPSFFIKNIRYSGTNFFGFGADVIINITKDISFYAGYSSYKRPISIIEENYMGASTPIDGQNIKTAQAGLNLSIGKLTASLSVFNYQNDNSFLPIINIYTDSLLINEIGYFTTASSNNTGVSLNINYTMWKLLLVNNASYYYLQDSERNYTVPEFIISGGLYYVDTLFNRNLQLKAGINYKFYGIQDPSVYDFQMSRSSNYFIDNSNTTPTLINDNRISPAFQLDFFVAGRIQEAAIVYLVFENILNRKYYLSPNYPMFGPAFRFGLAWEFFD